MTNKNVQPVRYFRSTYFNLTLCERGLDVASYISAYGPWSWGQAPRGFDEPYVPDTLIVLLGIPLAV